MRQIAAKTDGRNSLKVSIDKEVANQSTGKMNSLGDTHSPKSDIPMAAGHHAVMSPCKGNPLPALIHLSPSLFFSS